jgi:phosphatidylglycerol lysyltransferase
MTRSQARRERARELVLRWGWNATAYQLVNRGIAHWFAARGDAVVGYVRKNGVFVVAGAPVCALERLPAVLAEWERFAGARGVCYFGAAGRIEKLLGDCDTYSTVVLGAQPVWNPQNWAALVGGHKSLRAQLARARNKGVAIEEWTPGRAENHSELCRCLHEWLGTRGLPSLHFLVEPQTLSNLQGRRIFVAVQNGRAVGFLNASPIPQRSGWLTEQFVRGDGAPNGTVELLVDAMMRAVAADGACYATMGLVPLSQRVPLKSADNPLWLRVLLAWLRAHGRRFYNFQGLEEFKAKFRPEDWEPIYAIANEARFSPRSLYAIAAAFSGVPPWVAVASGMVKALAQEIRWLREAQ